MTLNITRSNAPCIHVTTVHESQISAGFTLRAFVFELTLLSHIETSALNDPQIILNTTRLKVSYKCSTTVVVPQSPNFYLFLSTAICFQVTDHYGTVVITQYGVAFTSSGQSHFRVICL